MIVGQMPPVVRVLNADGAAAALAAVELSVTRDDGAAPYAVSRTRVVTPTDATAGGLLDPAAGAFLDVGEPYVLRVSDAAASDEAITELVAVSAEQAAIDCSVPAPDQSMWGMQASVLRIIASVLDRVHGVGGWVRGGVWPADRPWKTFQSATNLVPGGSFEVGVGGWLGAQATIAAVTTPVHAGGHALQITPINEFTSRAEFPASLTPGTTYTMSAWLYTSAVMTGTAVVTGRFLQVIGAVAGQQFIFGRSESAPNVKGQWNQVRCTFTVPKLVDAGSVYVRIINGTTAANKVLLYADDVLLVEGDGLDTDATSPIAPFDGETADTAEYRYAWDGDRGASSSTRTPMLDRGPDTVTWNPGTSGWDLLTPILQTLRLRLFSPGYQATDDGAVVAVWMLTENDTATPGPRLTVRDGVNLIRFNRSRSDTASFPDGTPMFANQVIIHYTWTDSRGQTQEAWDAWPDRGRKPYLLEEQAPFPGPGRAEGICKRMRARQHVADITCLHAPSVQPGDPITLTTALIGGSLSGYVDAITHEPTQGRSAIRTKQLADTPDNAWINLTGTWADQPGSWAELKGTRRA